MTPTQAFVAAAQETQEVTDAAERTLMFRRIGPLDRLRLFKAVGRRRSHRSHQKHFLLRLRWRQARSPV
jgi:hypothetical protein